MSLTKAKKRFKGIGFDGLAMTFARAITLLLGIVTTRILSNRLSLAEYGTYSEAITIVSVITSITIFGLTDAMIYFFNSENSTIDKQKAANTIFLIELIISVASSLVVFALFSSIVDYYSNNLLWPLLAYILLEPLVDNSFSLLLALYISQGKAKMLSVRNLITSFIKLAIVCVGTFVFKSVFWILMFILISNLFQLILFVFWHRRFSFFINPFNCDISKVKKILIFGFSMSIIVCTNTLIKQCDKIVLGNLISVEKLAVYENASKQLPFDLIVVSLISVSSPVISKLSILNKNDELGQFLKKYNTICLLSLIVLAMPAIIGSKQMMLFLYGDKFISGEKIFKVYMLCEIVKFSNISILLISKNKKTELALVSFAALILNYGLDKLLFREVGEIGCAIASLFITLFIQFYLLFRSASLIKSGIFKILDLKAFLLPLVVFASLITIDFIFVSKVTFTTNNLVLDLCIYYGIPFLVLLGASLKPIISAFKGINVYKTESISKL